MTDFKIPKYSEVVSKNRSGKGNELTPTELFILHNAGLMPAQEERFRAEVRDMLEEVLTNFMKSEEFVELIKGLFSKESIIQYLKDKELLKSGQADLLYSYRPPYASTPRSGSVVDLIQELTRYKFKL